MYILIDALDESPWYGQRDGVLSLLIGMRLWNLPGLYLLAPSQDEHDIREALSLSLKEDLILRNNVIDEDISDFISGHLRLDLHL